MFYITENRLDLLLNTECLEEQGLPQDLKAHLHIIVQNATRGLGDSLACQASQGRDDVLDEGERLSCVRR